MQIITARMQKDVREHREVNKEDVLGHPLKFLSELFEKIYIYTPLYPCVLEPTHMYTNHSHRTMV